eukprot:GCRY01003015.1.p1 GENE.GCRY01003015.1~~GCRY01003015.1.p1  ORF type:complete len:324 (+),score=49.60 GCRY01003015.1:208-1179(+)
MLRLVKIILKYIFSVYLSIFSSKKIMIPAGQKRCVYALSDLHTNYSENTEWIRQLSDQQYSHDIIIIAGDVHDDLNKLKDTLLLLKEKFQTVFFTPGNHDFWVSKRNPDYTSFDKLNSILELCQNIGVHTGPTLLDEKVWIVPLFSWYEASLCEPITAYPETLSSWMDFYRCTWPPSVAGSAQEFKKGSQQAIAQHMLVASRVNASLAALNESALEEVSHWPTVPVVTFSHFLPRADLLPDVSKLFFKALPLVSGTPVLEHQLRKLSSSLHIFGHSHINCDRQIEGVRYVSHPLKYPSERKMWEKGGYQAPGFLPKMVYSYTT